MASECVKKAQCALFNLTACRCGETFLLSELETRLLSTLLFFSSNKDILKTHYLKYINSKNHAHLFELIHRGNYSRFVDSPK